MGHKVTTFTNRDLRDLTDKIQPEVPHLGGPWLVRFMLTIRRHQQRKLCRNTGFAVSPMD
jgi:hypothetical protein